MTAMIVLYAVVQFADVVTTLRALRKGAREANPIIDWLMQKLGFGWVPVKLAGSMVALYYLVELGDWWWILALNVLIGYVAYRNYKLV